MFMGWFFFFCFLFSFFFCKIEKVKNELGIFLVFREAGVGFASSPPHVATHDIHRAELLKLLLTCFSEAMYLPPSGTLSFCGYCNSRSVSSGLKLQWLGRV